MRVFKAGLLVFFAMQPIRSLASSSPSMAISESRYGKAHSLGNSYVFDPRDGWWTANVTNLQYKYQHQEFLERRSPRKKKVPQKSGLGEAIKGVLKGVVQGLKGIGNPEPVTITWYTGKDLKNPSCWENGNWSPTDESFACALTSEGWVSRPKCFKFLELCNSPKKCVFVRVVDTCAGCAPGSKHVDLTRAAFGELADYEIGQLQVQYRLATEPESWHENLWGPKV